MSAQDRLPPAVVHYLAHVANFQEWPSGTSLEQYLESLRQVILDSTAGVLLSTFRDKGWHLTFVRRSGVWLGPDGWEWLMVEYNVALGRWVTAFQLRAGLDELDKPIRGARRWLREPA